LKKGNRKWKKSGRRKKGKIKMGGAPQIRPDIKKHEKGNGQSGKFVKGNPILRGKKSKVVAESLSRTRDEK